MNDIETEANVEVLQVKTERFGVANFVAASGAQEIHRDDFGILYRKNIPGDEPLMVVKVLNAIAEPDGIFKDYLPGSLSPRLAGFRFPSLRLRREIRPDLAPPWMFTR